MAGGPATIDHPALDLPDARQSFTESDRETAVTTRLIDGASPYSLGTIDPDRSFGPTVQ
jgi:hypothetical protein